MIVLAVTIRCKKEKLRAAHDFFASFVPKARAEPGCIQYDLFQATADPAVFYFFEKWADQTSFDLHSKQLYLLEFHARFGELLAEPNQVLYLAPISNL
jgi:quinol monooxygenase YgiN